MRIKNLTILKCKENVRKLFGKELTILSIDDRLKVSITNRQTRDYFFFPVFHGNGKKETVDSRQ